MIFNIKKVFVTIICTALFFGCSAVSTVTAVDTPSGTGATTEDNLSTASDSDTFIKLVNNGGGDSGDDGDSGEGGDSGERETNARTFTPADPITAETLDIQIDCENKKIIYGASWTKFDDEEHLKKELEKIADLDKAEELFTIYSVGINEETSGNPCTTYMWSGNRLKCVPYGCEKPGHVSAVSDSDAFIKLVSGGGGDSGGCETNARTFTPADPITAETLDIQVDYENKKIIYGASWTKFDDEEHLKEELGEIADLDKAQELITVYSVVLNPRSPRHRCTVCWWDQELNRLKCIPYGCEPWGH